MASAQIRFPRRPRAASRSAQMSKDKDRPAPSPSAKLTQGSITGHLVGQTLPAIIGVAAVMSIGLVDAYFIGQLGSDALAAISFIFPISVAPFQVLITLLAKGEGEAQTAAEKLYADLRAQGIEVLLDDRRENPGVKFNDADLIGIPVRVTVGDRGLKKGIVEFKLRREEERGEVPLEGALEHIINAVRQLEQELRDRVVAGEYKE